MIFREHPQSMCQLIMTKLAIPDGATQQEYWETLIEEATNNKFYNLRASMKNNLFNQFKGMYIDTY
jgi:hypothetical protein